MGLLAAVLLAQAAPSTAASRSRDLVVAATEPVRAFRSPGVLVRARVPKGTRVVELALYELRARARIRIGHRVRRVEGRPDRWIAVRYRVRPGVLARLRAGHRYVITLRAGPSASQIRGRTLSASVTLVGRRRGPRPLPAPSPVIAASPAVAAPAVAAPAPGGPAAAQDAPPDPVVAAAGDVACHLTGCGQAATASLISDVIRPTAILGLGDFQYPATTLADLAADYEPSWGRFKAITYTTVGNHDQYGTGDFLTYFNAGGPVPLVPEGSYSFDVGAWHVVSLDSFCIERTTCDETTWAGWLVQDLALHPSACTLAFFHQPYWTSPSQHPPLTRLRPWIQILYDAGVDVVLAGHNHHYERFAPQTPDNVLDEARGITSFIVGTGGAPLDTIKGLPAANSVVRDASTHGVLELTMHPGSYDFRFLPVPGGTFTDAGTGTCH